ncbi:hypothetical protein [Pseudorhodoferax sp.]|uniref:hypothetical protein n=1 Tax=Pseudorhodoferax sp. TaxID=1993553 RepID=UPI002DD632B9|nr:hypothetical protein [Pseudorhodoferax sp.]
MHPARSQTRLPLALGSLVLLAGCAAPQAVLYAEGGPRQQARAQQALQACELQAQRAVGLNAGHQAARRNAGTTTAVAMVGGAVAALVKGGADVARTALAAGAAGAAGAATKSAIEWNAPDEVYEEHVKLCMERRGHVVLGWR